MQFTTSIDRIYALQIESVEIRLQIFPMFTVLYSENIILSAWLQSRANRIKLLSTAEGITENLHTETKKKYKNTKTSKTAKTSQWNTAAFLACILVFFCAFIRKFSQSVKNEAFFILLHRCFDWVMLKSMFIFFACLIALWGTAAACERALHIRPQPTQPSPLPPLQQTLIEPKLSGRAASTPGAY